MRLTRWLIGLVVVLGLVGLYFLVVINWSYSAGERAGWVQKLSRKGWLCKTWEGELALVSLPGSPPEKFPFTISDDAVAEQLNQAMKVGVLGSGDVAKALAGGFIKHGYDVKLGTRDPAKLEA